jgi:uncharacterized protein YbjQ (UPF0145 family)
MDRRESRQRSSSAHTAKPMKISYAQQAGPGRRHRTIGLIQAVANWRGAMSPVTETDRQALVRALILEAEEYEADAIVEVRFAVDSVQSADIDATSLRRVRATALAVRYADAA